MPHVPNKSLEHDALHAMPVARRSASTQPAALRARLSSGVGHLQKVDRKGKVPLNIA